MCVYYYWEDWGSGGSTEERLLENIVRLMSKQCWMWWWDSWSLNQINKVIFFNKGLFDVLSINKCLMQLITFTTGAICRAMLPSSVLFNLYIDITVFCNFPGLLKQVTDTNRAFLADTASFLPATSACLRSQHFRSKSCFLVGAEWVVHSGVFADHGCPPRLKTARWEPWDRAAQSKPWS